MPVPRFPESYWQNTHRREERIPETTAEEWALVGGLIAVLVFAPWAIGSRTVWAQFTLLGLGAITFALALWSRPGSAKAGTDNVVSHGWQSLRTFPPFWLGSLFLIYVAVGACNPSWRLQTTELVWFIRSQTHVTWLPSSIEAPVEKMNAWRMLAIYGALWLTACAVWAGITKRQTLLVVLHGFLVSGTLLGLVAILQKITKAKKIFWTLPSPTPSFHASFVYDNHAAAYLNLVVAVALGMALWRYVRGVKRMEKSTPAPLYAFCAVVVGIALLMGGSRTGTLLLLGYTATAGLIFLGWQVFFNRDGSKTLAVIMTVLVLGFLGGAGAYLNLKRGIFSATELFKPQKRADVEFRVTARQATWDMFEDRALLGWGAGSFRHAFPDYQQQHPSITRRGRRMLYWDHAHNDYYQLLAEVGMLGALFPALCLLWVLWRFVRNRGLANPGFLLLACGLGLPFIHSWVDFPLYNAAILISLGTLITCLLRWSELNAARERSLPGMKHT